MATIYTAQTSMSQQITDMNIKSENMMKDMMFADFPDVMTIYDIQKSLGIGRTAAYKLINTGKIKHLRIGKSIKIPKQFLIDYILSECYTDDM